MQQIAMWLRLPVMGSFAEWFAGRRLGLLRFATALCLDPETAQDVVQEVAFRACTRWMAIQELAHPDAYLRRMVVNEYLSWRRKWGRLITSSDLVDEHSGTSRDEIGGVDDRDQLRAGLMNLSPRQRTVIVLRFYEGFTDVEVAALLHCPRSTVRSLQARALQRLRVDLVDAAPPRSNSTRSPRRSIDVDFSPSSTPHQQEL